MTTESGASGIGGGATGPEGAVRLPTGWSVRWVDETGSTNADLVALALEGGRHGTVLCAEVQGSGRGRRGRSWSAPAGDALLFSVLVRPEAVPPARRSWVGAILGLAIVEALTDVTGVVASLKWPNDVLIKGRKVAGILAEVSGDAVVVGAGINITVGASELPRADATSLLLEDALPPVADGRAVLLGEILERFAALLRSWESAAGDVRTSGIHEAYLRHCSTIGSVVAVHLPDGSIARGSAVGVGEDGSILVAAEGAAEGADEGAAEGADEGFPAGSNKPPRQPVGAVRAFAAGDVEHLRPSGPDPTI